jgi:hypothetical protein
LEVLCTLFLRASSSLEIQVECSQLAGSHIEVHSMEVVAENLFGDFRPSEVWPFLMPDSFEDVKGIQKKVATPTSRINYTDVFWFLKSRGFAFFFCGNKIRAEIS